ncbi:transaldolase [Candidatus Saccharibacteria bacterium]|jgi:transaldolase|nr:transaldolase [Candidatus Saccharibacteria bacterium]
MSRLHSLFDEFGQSPWLDNLSRETLEDGTIQRYIDDGIRGITSNPTIFEKAMGNTDIYDEQFKKLQAKGLSVEDSYWEMAITDIRSACKLFQPLYQSSGGNDGFVSIEVDPRISGDTQATVAMAKDLWERVDMNNVMIKIPATKAGIPAIEEAIAQGINVNVTLIFSLVRYQEVLDAYTKGVERFDGPNAPKSVGSFFVSRVDTAVDNQLKAIDPQHELMGSAATAQARVAYGMFLDQFKDSHISLQRPLWASTSTKNPNYPDTLYIDELIAANSVNTITENSIKLFNEHGTLATTITPDNITEAQEQLRKLEQVGVNLEKVAGDLEEAGVSSFEESFDSLLQTLANKN